MTVKKCSIVKIKRDSEYCQLEIKIEEGINTLITLPIQQAKEKIPLVLNGKELSSVDMNYGVVNILFYKTKSNEYCFVVNNSLNEQYVLDNLAEFKLREFLEQCK